MRAGHVERREFEDVRHGTQALIANCVVGTGKVVTPSLGPTRTEADCAAPIDRTVATDPDAAWVFVVDHLDTHRSETLVRLVAARGGSTDDLGVKEKPGLRKSMATRTASRTAFLTDATHRRRFVYTPKHCSWRNQIELWFSILVILVRKLLRRASFTSTDDLRARILDVVASFNRTMAKPFKWPSPSSGPTPAAH